MDRLCREGDIIRSAKFEYATGERGAYQLGLPEAEGRNPLSMRLQHGLYIVKMVDTRFANVPCASKFDLTGQLVVVRPIEVDAQGFHEVAGDRNLYYFSQYPSNRLNIAPGDIELIDHIDCGDELPHTD